MPLLVKRTTGQVPNKLTVLLFVHRTTLAVVSYAVAG